MRRPQDEAVQVAPRRLVEGTDRTAALLWRARKIPPPGGEKNFSALLARRETRVRRTRVGVALVAACLPLGLLLWSERSPTELLIAPERFGALVDPRDAVDTAAALPEANEDTAPATPTKGDEESSGRKPRSHPAPAQGTEDTTARNTATKSAAEPTKVTEATEATSPRPPDDPRAPSQSPQPRPPADGDLTGGSAHPRPTSAERRESASPEEERCSTWTSQGDYEAAADCFGRKAAQDTGVSAEWALLEKARIRSRAQGKPAEALRTLDEYEARFPDGSLAREARLSRIEILTSAGRTGEALRTLDDTLQHNQIPERTGELLLLRAQLRSETGRCEGALEDVQAALQQGVTPARARAIQDKCAPAGDPATR